MTVEEKAIARYEQGVKAGIYEPQDVIAVLELEPQRIGHGERSSTARVQKPTINAAQRVAIRNKGTFELIARFYI